MKRSEVRLECLKIAATRTSDPNLILATAQQFEAYVFPPSSGSSDKPKGPEVPPDGKAPATPERESADGPKEGAAHPG